MSDTDQFLQDPAFDAYRLKGFGGSFLRVNDTGVYWQARNHEGRPTLFKDGKELFDQEMTASTRVHEYGGGCYLLKDQKVVFSHGQDQKLYCFEKEKITCISQIENSRYVDGVAHEKKPFLYFVREVHNQKQDPKNTLVLLNENLKTEQVIHSKHDFYSSPRLNQKGTRLAFIAWDQPNMPWDSSYLYLADLDEEGKIISTKKIAGGKNISCLEPKWFSETLFFLEDSSGFMNVYTYDHEENKPFFPLKKEFGYPHWIFGKNTYFPIAHQKVLALVSDQAKHEILLLENGKKQSLLEVIDPNIVAIKDLFLWKNTLHLVASYTNKPDEYLQYHLQSGTVKRPFSQSVNNPYPHLQVKRFCFPTKDKEYAYGFVYLPKVKEKIPLILKVHSGPTSVAMPVFDAEAIFWNSKGYAFAEINYRGSCGFGKEYRDKLKENWGVIDVQDCIDCAKYLVDRYQIDKNKMVIKGKSSGGFSALRVLMIDDTFQAATSYYGVIDLIDLQNSTHKFERFYNESLIGPFPEKRKRYEERSILSNADQLKKPVLLFHGEKDLVVLSEQSEKLYKKIHKNQPESRMYLYQNEGHSFKSLDNIQTSLLREEQFYRSIFADKRFLRSTNR